MSNTYVCIVILASLLTQAISSLETVNDEHDKQIDNFLECLPKNSLYNIISRDRRASISRPYFNHWRDSRDNSRYLSKNLLAFSPRLGKRDIEDDGFIQFLINYLQTKNIDIIIDDDENKICFSETIDDGLIKEAFEKFQIDQRQRERQRKSRHPLLFRYRLG